MAMQSGPRGVAVIDKVAAHQGWPLRGVPLYKLRKKPCTDFWCVAGPLGRLRRFQLLLPYNSLI